MDASLSFYGGHRKDGSGGLFVCLEKNVMIHISSFVRSFVVFSSRSISDMAWNCALVVFLLLHSLLGRCIYTYIHLHISIRVFVTQRVILGFKDIVLVVSIQNKWIDSS
jgi:hypothetical protein